MITTGRFHQAQAVTYSEILDHKEKLKNISNIKIKERKIHRKRRNRTSNRLNFLLIVLCKKLIICSIELINRRYIKAITYYEKALALSTRSLSAFAGLAYTYHLMVTCFPHPRLPLTLFLSTCYFLFLGVTCKIS